MMGPDSGAVPLPQNQQQVDLASAGAQISQALGQIQGLDTEIVKTLPAATTPVKTSGVASPTLPGSFNFGVGQPSMVTPQGGRDAKRQGVAKTIAGVANIVGQVLQQKKAEKQRVLATDIHRVLESQDAISQAQQQLAADPNNKDAQALVEKNKQIINDTIGSDPKKLKQFEKAFDINFLDPSKNTTDEHGALKAASKSYADQLQAKTPDKLAPNVAAQAKVQALTAQRAAIDSQVKAIMPAYVQQTRDANAAQRVQYQQENANARQDSRNQTTASVANQRAAVAAAQQATNLQIAKIRSSTAYGVEARRDAASMERTNALIEGRKTLSEKLHNAGKNGQAEKLDEQIAALYQKESDKLTDRIYKTIQVRDADVQAGASETEVNNWNDRINMMKSQQATYQKGLSAYAKSNFLPPEEKGGTNVPSDNGRSSKPPIIPKSDGKDDSEPTDDEEDREIDKLINGDD